MKSSVATSISIISSRTSTAILESLSRSQSPSKNAIALQEYLVIYGDARVTEGGAVPLLQRLARIYVGPDADFPPAELRDRPGFMTRITPHRFAGVGPWSSRQV